MEIKVKKRMGNNVHRVQGTGEVKEIFSNMDFTNPKEGTIQICFKGEHCSGIIELSREEAKNISKNVSKMAKLGKKIKVIRLKD